MKSNPETTLDRVDVEVVARAIVQAAHDGGGSTDLPDTPIDDTHSGDPRRVWQLWITEAEAAIHAMMALGYDKPRGMAGGLADHAEMQAVAEEALRHG